MKRLFILIAVCMIGMVLPQGVFAAATVTVSDGTVTINTDKAGDLKAYLKSASDADKAAIRNASSIVFDGKFNKADLDALNEASCCTQSTVDMSEAKFVKEVGGAGNNIKLYNSNLPQNGHEGDRCIVCGHKYQRGDDGQGYYWQEISYTDGSELGNDVERFDKLDEAGAATSEWRVLLVGGTEYVFKKAKPGSQEQDGWVDVSQGGEEEYDFKQMKFDFWKNTLTTAITSRYASGEKVEGIFNECSQLTNVTYNSGIIGKPGNNTTRLNTITIGSDVTEIAKEAFQDKTSITTLNMDNATSLVKIGEAAFQRTSIGNELVFPASLQEIEAMAFGSCPLTYVTFKPDSSHPFVIREDAFNGITYETLKQVTVETPLYQIDGVYYPQCEYGAFSFDATDAQTQVAHILEATLLVLPEVTNPSEEEANYEWFVGHYKDGLQITNQADLIFSRDERARVVEAKGAGTKNGGWWQFFRSTSSNIIEFKGDFIRTFSDVRPFFLPKMVSQNAHAYSPNDYSTINKVEGKDYIYNNERTYIYDQIEDLVQAYRVINYSEEKNSEGGYDRNPINPTVTAKRIYDYIPSQTGVILKSAKSTDEALLYLKDWTLTDTQYPYDGSTNYLEKMIKGGEDIGPVKKENGVIVFRNFAFTTKKAGASKTNPKFLRVKKDSKTTENRAYLKLTPAQFPHSNEEENGLDTDFQNAKAFSFGVTTSLNSATSSSSSTEEEPAISIQGFENVTGYILLSEMDEILKEQLGVATQLDSVEKINTEDDSFYTIEGVHVKNPSKGGVYIRNGKKYIIR